MVPGLVESIDDGLKLSGKDAIWLNSAQPKKKKSTDNERNKSHDLEDWIVW